MVSRQTKGRPGGRRLLQLPYNRNPRRYKLMAVSNLTTSTAARQPPDTRVPGPKEPVGDPQPGPAISVGPGKDKQLIKERKDLG
jgi:hypothetical protein